MKVKVAIGYLNGNWCVFGWSNYSDLSNKEIVSDYLSYPDNQPMVKEIEIEIPDVESEA
jgi:hypothetical protein